MKKLILILSFLLLTNSVFAEDSKKVVVGKTLAEFGAKDTTAMIKSIVVDPDEFTIRIINTKGQTFNDITGEDLDPVYIVGYKLGETSKNDYFKIIVPRSYNKVYFYNINKWGKSYCQIWCMAS